MTKSRYTPTTRELVVRIEEHVGAIDQHIVAVERHLEMLNDTIDLLNKETLTLKLHQDVIERTAGEAKADRRMLDRRLDKLEITKAKVIGFGLGIGLFSSGLGAAIVRLVT